MEELKRFLSRRQVQAGVRVAQPGAGPAPPENTGGLGLDGVRVISDLAGGEASGRVTMEGQGGIAVSAGGGTVTLTAPVIYLAATPLPSGTAPLITDQLYLALLHLPGRLIPRAIRLALDQAPPAVEFSEVGLYLPRGASQADLLASLSLDGSTAQAEGGDTYRFPLTGAPELSQGAIYLAFRLLAPLAASFHTYSLAGGVAALAHLIQAHPSGQPLPQSLSLSPGAAGGDLPWLELSA